MHLVPGLNRSQPIFGPGKRREGMPAEKGWEIGEMVRKDTIRILNPDIIL